MPSLQDIQRNQAVQSAQSGIYDQQFDPDVILQEIANKDLQLQAKEEELSAREQGLMAQEQQAQESTAAAPPEDEKLMMAIQLLNDIVSSRQPQEQPQENEQVPVVPLKSEVSPTPPAGAQAPAQGPAMDVSESTMQNLQPGQEVSVTKRIVMTPDGPMEVGRSEKIKGITQSMQQPQQQQQQPMPQQQQGM